MSMSSVRVIPHWKDSGLLESTDKSATAIKLESLARFQAFACSSSICKGTVASSLSYRDSITCRASQMFVHYLLLTIKLLSVLPSKRLKLLEVGLSVILKLVSHV